jgi:L-2-hydroxyglutarate oxidase LhgO
VKEIVTVDIAIIGGGIVGLATAYEISKKLPQAEVALFDKEPNLGEHSSGRNSGVLHAGLYYPYGSLKHLLCLEGNRSWDQYAQDLNIGIRRCGKLIFSNSNNEETKLNELFQKAIKNNVPIREPNQSELALLNQNVHATNAICSPSTGIINVSEALKNLKYVLESRGIHVYYSSEILKIINLQDEFELELSNFKIHSNVIINCAGLNSIDLRLQLGMNEFKSYIVKGNYLTTTQKLTYDTLYYPIPPKDLKGLGVHSTIDLDGKVKFGPNTEDVDQIDYSPPKQEMNEMKNLVTKYFKNIDELKLYWDYAGCRPKIIRSKTKDLFTDFIIESPIKNYIECLGIESPGITAAPAIAKMVSSIL